MITTPHHGTLPSPATGCTRRRRGGGRQRSARPWRGKRRNGHFVVSSSASRAMAAKRAHSPEPETRAPSPVASAIAAILASFPATITPRLPPIGLLHQLYARGLLSRTAIDREYDSLVRAGDIISLHYDAAPPERIFLRIAGDDDDRHQQHVFYLLSLHTQTTPSISRHGATCTRARMPRRCAACSQRRSPPSITLLCALL